MNAPTSNIESERISTLITNLFGGCSAPKGANVIAQGIALGIVTMRLKGLKGRDTRRENFALFRACDIPIHPPSAMLGYHMAPRWGLTMRA